MCAILLSSSVAYSADECKEIHGYISTNTISQTPQQLGVIGIRSVGKRKTKTCGILGTITGYVEVVAGGGVWVPSELEHLISCKDHSTIETEDYVTVTSAVPCAADMDMYILSIEEESVITDGTGRFNGASGGITTTGIVNSCTGINSFTYEGELCTPED